MMFVVVEGQDSTCPCLDPLLLLISKAHVKHMTCIAHTRIPSLSHTYLQEKLTELT